MGILSLKSCKLKCVGACSVFQLFGTSVVSLRKLSCFFQTLLNAISLYGEGMRGGGNKSLFIVMNNIL